MKHHFPGRGALRACALFGLAVFGAAAVLLGSAGEAAAGSTTGLGPDSIYRWVFVGDPRIAPDGKRIAYVVARVDRDRDEYDYDLWVQDSPGGTPRAFTNGVSDDRSPRWSPKGDRIAFLSNRSGKRQIHILDMRGGEPWQLTVDAEGVGSFAWSPDGKRIAFASTAAAEGEPGFQPPKDASEANKKVRPAMVTERLHVRSDGAPGWRNERLVRLWTVATDSGPKQEAKRLTHGEYDDGDPVWSADGRNLYFSANQREDADYVPDSEIYVVPADGSAAPRAITSRHGPDEGPLPSPDGRWIAYTGYDEGTPPQSTNVSHLYLMRPDGSQSRRLAPDFDRSVPDSMIIDFSAPRVNGSRMAWTPDSRRILFVSSDSGQTQLYSADVASGRLTQLTRLPQGELREFSVSSESTVAGTFDTPTQPTEIYSFPLKNAGREGWTRVSKHTDGLAGEGQFVPYEEIWYASFDGQRIQGWILKPPGFDARKKYPMILYIHGGPHAMYGTGFFHEFQVLANQGFVVLITNPRGSTGYGERFGNVIQYHYPGDDYKDLMLGVDEMLERGYVDADRLGVAGGSGGGLLTSWIVGHTDRFKAAVVERPVTNWHNFIGASDLNYYFATHWFHDFPWRDSADYLARSPLTYVDQVKTPVMVIQSEQDYRTPLDQGLQFYTALKMLKKPAKLVVFPESSHGLSRDGPPGQRVERLKLIGGWFGEKLQP